MFSEYLLSDNFEKSGDGGFSSRGGPDGSGCLVLFAVLGSMVAAGLCRLIAAVVANRTFFLVI